MVQGREGTENSQHWPAQDWVSRTLEEELDRSSVGSVIGGVPDHNRPRSGWRRLDAQASRSAGLK